MKCEVERGTVSFLLSVGYQDRSAFNNLRFFYIRVAMLYLLINFELNGYQSGNSWRLSKIFLNMDGFIIEKDKPDLDVWLWFLNLLLKSVRICFKYLINLWNGYLNATPKAKYLDHHQKVIVGSQDWSNICSVSHRFLCRSPHHAAFPRWPRSLESMGCFQNLVWWARAFPQCTQFRQFKRSMS